MGSRFYIHTQLPVAGTDSYIFAIVKRVKEFPLAVETTKQIAIVHNNSEAVKLCAELNEQYKEGVIAGMRRFAWWKDGVEYVGSCGTTLKQAIEDFVNER